MGFPEQARHHGPARVPAQASETSSSERKRFLHWNLASEYKPNIPDLTFFSSQVVFHKSRWILGAGRGEGPFHTRPGCRQRKEGRSRVIFRQEFMSGLQLELGPPLKGWQGKRGQAWGRGGTRKMRAFVLPGDFWGSRPLC